MGRRGPAPRPQLAVVREGNPGKRRQRDGVTLPPAQQLAEPDWREIFPMPPASTRLAAGDGRGAITRARNVARREWRRVVPTLVRSVGLNEVDWVLVTDYCVCIARIDQGERALSRQGVVVRAQRGSAKNGWSTIVGQYRAQLKGYMRELGLSPSARTVIPPASNPEDGDPFD